MSRSAVEERRWSRLAGLALLLFGSLCVVLWALGSGVPYGYDSSGTYLTYRAAYNATTFPRSNALVADISLSPDPAAHPAYDLRSPNAFGQLFSQLLIRAGISELAKQTALAIGVSIFGAFLAVKVLTRLGGPVLALVTTLLFTFQYVGVLTWTTNLQAALHFPLFWGNLYLLLRYVDRPSRARLAAVAAGIAAVFVNDLALGAFVLLTELFLYWQLPRLASARLTLALSAVAGAAAGVLLLFVVAGSAVVTALLPTDLADQWLQTPSALHAMSALGQGALTILVFGVLVAELARAVCLLLFGGRTWHADLAILLVLIVLISAIVLLDRSQSVIDAWELVPGRPIVHVGLWLALLGLVCAFGLRLKRRESLLADPSDVGARPEGLTARSFVLAVGLAILVLVLVPIGNFTETYLRYYEPAVVFLEDVVLAVFALALIDRIRLAGRSAQSVAIAAVLVLVGSYWVVFQGKLALRYPPREIPVASALRGNAAMAGAPFIAPNLPEIVWYYTRGPASSDDAGLAALPAFLVCARVPTDAPAPTPLQCGQWTESLARAAGAVGPGRTLFRTTDYAIDDLQPCSALNEPTPAANAACATQPAAPPSLEPLDGTPNASSVELTVTLQPTQSLAHVDYQYAQGAGTPEEDSILRLYVLRSSGSWCMIEEAVGSHDLHFPPASAGQFRAAVIPRSALAIGQPYFSDSLQVQTPIVIDLPNTRDGGVQQIQADSIEQAQQQALAAGTWNPGAGTLGPDSKHLLVQAATADQQCRR